MCKAEGDAANDLSLLKRKKRPVIPPRRKQSLWPLPAAKDDRRVSRISLVRAFIPSFSRRRLIRRGPRHALEAGLSAWRSWTRISESGGERAAAIAARLDKTGRKPIQYVRNCLRSSVD